MAWYSYLIEIIKQAEHLIIALLFGLVNSVMRPIKGSPWLYVAEVFISVTVASLVGYIVDDLGASTALSYALVAVTALLARDLLNIIIGFGDFVSDRREVLYEKAWKKILKFLGKK